MKRDGIKIYYALPNFNAVAVEVGIVNQVHQSHYWRCDYLSMPGLKLTHASKCLCGKPFENDRKTSAISCVPVIYDAPDAHILSRGKMDAISRRYF